MKRFVSIILISVLMLSIAALAEVSYTQTQNFLDALSRKDVKYSIIGEDDNGNEQIRVSWSDDDFGSIAMNIFFNKNGTVSYRVWNIVDFSCGLNYAYQVCNELNSDYKYAKFYVDTSDNSITASADIEINLNADCGDACVEMMSDVLMIIDAGRDKLLMLK